MIFVLTETWPVTSSVEVGKETIKLAGRALPSHMKMLGPFVVLGGDGVKTYTIFEVEQGSADESYSEMMRRLSGLFRIPGYKPTIEVAISTIEALPLVGL